MVTVHISLLTLQMDDYDTVFDSFVVDNSVVEYVSSLDELDMVDEFESDVEPSKKTRYSGGSKSELGNSNTIPIQNILKF